MTPTGARTPNHRTAEAKATAVEAAHDAQAQAAHFAEKARQQVKAQIAGQKDQATERLGHLSEALRHTSNHLRDQNESATAGFVDQAAHQVEGLSDYLRHHTVGELVGEAERFARREPAMFLGGALLLGLVGARFLKSSGPDDGPSSRHESGGRSYASQSRPETSPTSYPPTYPNPQARVITPATVAPGGTTPQQIAPGLNGGGRNG